MGRGGGAGSRGGTVVAALLFAAAGAAAAPAPAAPDAAAPERAGPIAVLPLVNLGDASAPLDDIRGALCAELEARGVALLDDATLEAFLRRHRVRWVSGLAPDTGRALEAETGAAAVLVASVDRYGADAPPSLALTARLVSAGETTRIVWMDGAGLAGDDAPGFLGLGRIEDPLVVRHRVLARVADSLARRLGAMGDEGGRSADATRARPERRFAPRSAWRSSAPPAGDGTVRVALLPFADTSGAAHAGEVVALRLLQALVRSGRVDVLEPGIVRETLLNARLIQQEGPSIPQADLLRSLTGVDVVLFGEVEEYMDAGPGAVEPEVDYSFRAIDTRSRQVIWASISHHRGGERVVFFDVGRVRDARTLAGRMADALIAELLPALERST